MAKKKTNKKKKKGFTLIELLIVIAIIGILASIVLVSLNSARQKAKKVSATSSLSSVMGELTICENEEGVATTSAPTGGATTVCCTDDTCDTPLEGHSVVWPDITTTGFVYDAPTGSLAENDYVFTATRTAADATTETITCTFATKGCQ